MSGDEAQNGPAAGGSQEWRIYGASGRRWLRILILLAAVMLMLRLVGGLASGWDAGATMACITAVGIGLVTSAQVRSGTRATEDGLKLRRGLTRPLVVPWSEVADLRAEGGRWATAVTMHLGDGRRYPLPGVQPEQLGEVQAARASVTGQER